MILLLLTYLSLFVVITVLLLCWYVDKFRFKRFDKITGPKPLPLIGNVIEIGSNPVELLENIYRFSRIYGDTFKVFIGPTVKIITKNANLIEKLIQSNVNISKSNSYDQLKAWLGDGLLISTGLKWKSRRKLITPSFHFTILERFIEIFDKNANILIKKLNKEIGKSSIDLVPFINLFSLDVICETSMGQQVNSQSDENIGYVTSVRQFLTIAMDRIFSSWKQSDLLFKISKDYPSFSKSLKELCDFSNRVIETREKTFISDKRSEQQGDDYGVKKKVALLDMLLEQKNNNRLTQEDIREEIDTFIFEGHDTVTAGTSFALYSLANHPEIQNKLYEEIMQELPNNNDAITSQQLNNLKYLDMVVKESLRIYPSVPIIERQLVEDMTFENQRFPAGTTISLFIYGMHHSDEYFPEPEKFDPERFSVENTLKRHKFAYLPFSAGPRNCIGQRYAVNEMKLTIVKVLQNFELQPVTGFEPQLGMMAVLKSINGLHIQIKSRSR